MDAKRKNMLMFLSVVVFLNLVALSIVNVIPVAIPCEIVSEQETLDSDLGKEVQKYFHPFRAWAWDKDDDTKKRVEDATRVLIRRGVPVEVFQDITINIFPLNDFVYIFAYFQQKDYSDSLADAIGITFFDTILNDEINYNIWLSGRDAQLVGTFTHEIGHVVCCKYLNVPGYDWAETNDMGKEYLKIKNYTVEKGLNQESQDALPWGERASEWFAEDFKWFFCDEYDHKAGPTPTPEVAEYFYRLFPSQRG